MEKHIIKHWKGTTASYNFLKSQGQLSPWTHYVVVNPTTSAITEYYGENIASVPTGQLLPVKDVVASVDSIQTPNPFDRYLIGNNADGYRVAEFQPKGASEELSIEMLTFDEKYGVRIASKGYKNFVYVNGKLITYDDVDCGEF